MNLDKHVSSKDLVVAEQLCPLPSFFSPNEPLWLSNFLSFTQVQGCRTDGKNGHWDKQIGDRQIHH